MLNIILKIEEIEPEAISSQEKEEKLQTSYQEIGQTLLISEAFFFKVGIPWLPPTKKVREYKKKCYSPLDEFIKSNLVNISTNHLQSYAEDLQQLSLADENSTALRIDKVTFLERHALTIILFLSIIFFTFFSNEIQKEPSFVTFMLSLFVSVVAAAFSLYSSSENHRRANFHWIISKELLRRKGLDKPNMRRLPIYAINTTPIIK
ncbi:MAG: hypothetical protein KBC84_09955 [Proteobacteria bacterium]|nr:hypothetical protein [Pseudomonadota bacterium]